MGQVESAAANHQTGPPSPSSAAAAATATATATSANNSQPASLDSLISEAAAYGNEAGNESLEAKAQKALDCPCIDHLRKGPCGAQFSDAFLCFLKSNAQEKGSDCVHPFVALQSCIKVNPNAFSKDILEGNEVEKEEKPAKRYRLIPPLWSVESKPPKKKH